MGAMSITLEWIRKDLIIRHEMRWSAARRSIYLRAALLISRDKSVLWRSNMFLFSGIRKVPVPISNCSPARDEEPQRVTKTRRFRGKSAARNSASFAVKRDKDEESMTREILQVSIPTWQTRPTK